MNFAKKNNVFIIILIFLFSCNLFLAQNKIEVSSSADFVSRYVWRGIQINDAPNIQPSLSLNCSGLSFGLWGSYSLSKINSNQLDFAVSQEIDAWISYSFELKNGISITALATDYYFPQGGLKLGNFNNYDDPNGPGAHTIELGLSVAGNKSFPITVSGYVNVYNDKGNNAYLQLDYSTELSNYNINLFAGAAIGNKDNPVYYGTSGFSFINVGISAQREIKVSESFSVPLSVSYIINPKAEISYLVFGLSF